MTKAMLVLLATALVLPGAAADIVGCSQCVKLFQAAGGCTMWQHGKDPSSAIPTGCAACDSSASAVCNISSSAHKGEGSGKTCFNGKDDDGDGFTDCQDPDCLNVNVNKYAKYCDGHHSNKGHESGKACFDGKDNDGDGVADCNDPDCKALASVYHRYCPNACQDNDAKLSKLVRGANCQTAKMMNLCTSKSMASMAKRFCPKTCNICVGTGKGQGGMAKTCKGDRSKTCQTSSKVTAHSCESRNIRDWCCKTCAKLTHSNSTGASGSASSSGKPCKDLMSQCKQYKGRCGSKGIRGACCATCSGSKASSGGASCKDSSNRCAAYRSSCRTSSKVRSYCCATCAASVSGGAAA